MNMPNFTEDEKLLINSGLSMIAGVVVGVGQSEYQYLTTNGHITFGGAIAFALATFGALMVPALRLYIPAHAQQAIRDAEARITQLEEALSAQTSTPAQPLVVIHTTGASVQSSANSVPSVAIPQRPVAPSAPKPVQLQAVVEPAQQTAVQPQQVWLSTTMSGSSGVQQNTTDDVLGDLPPSTGQPMQVQQITGVVPVYGASGK